jgi:hypothetical protein
LFVLENSLILFASFSIGSVMILEMCTVASNVPIATKTENISKIIPVDCSTDVRKFTKPM